MNFIFLSKQHLNPTVLTDGKFCKKELSHALECKVPPGHVPALCVYTGDCMEADSWTNQLTGEIHKENPFEFVSLEFYQMTPIEDPIFVEGYAWCPNANKMVLVEKTDPQSIWNPIFQRYERPCNNGQDQCEPNRIKYDSSGLHHIFQDDNIEEFFNVYCRCCFCRYCDRIHLCVNDICDREESDCEL